MLRMLLGISLCSLIAAPIAVGFVHEYVGGIGDLMLVCDENGAFTTPGLGGVCIEAGEIPPGFNGDATISLADDLNPAPSALYCQDLNENGICGDGCVFNCILDDCGLTEDIQGIETPIEIRVEIRSQGHGVHCEPFHSFCIDIALDSPIDRTPRPDWASENWDPTSGIFIFIDGPLYGSPLFSPCGPILSTGTHGFVSHQS